MEGGVKGREGGRYGAIKMQTNTNELAEERKGLRQVKDIRIFTHSPAESQPQACNYIYRGTCGD